MGVGLEAVSRFDVILVRLNPTFGSEIRKTRPCVVVSPDEMNHAVRTLLVAPLTSTSKPYPTRVSCRFEHRHGYVVLDQLRTIDRERIVRKLGTLDVDTSLQVLALLREMFSP
jgi:mRNA interferase MazF